MFACAAARGRLGKRVSASEKRVSASELCTSPKVNVTQEACVGGGSRRRLLLLFLALPGATHPRSGSYEPIGPPGGGSRRPFLNLDQVSVIPNSPRARGPESLVPVKGRTIKLDSLRSIYSAPTVHRTPSEAACLGFNDTTYTKAFGATAPPLYSS